MTSIAFAQSESIDPRTTRIRTAIIRLMPGHASQPVLVNYVGAVGTMSELKTVASSGECRVIPQ
jgi:hypothetical protein